VEQLFLAAALVGTVLFGTGSQSTTSNAPVNQTWPEVIGLDTVGSTLAVRQGTYTGSPASFTYRWRKTDGTTLGTGTTFGPLISGQIGTRIQVDETATNGGGSVTTSSDFVGPVEASLPTLPSPGAGTPPTTLPAYPANYIQNGWAIYPGCAIPDPTPANAGNPTHEWYFDSVNGHTISGGATGHFGSPFKDIAALFNVTTGYGASALFPSTILPGDIVYVKADPSGASVGTISASSAYSTSNGTSTGTTIFTYIMKDPASTLQPVFTKLSLNHMQGFVFENINAEELANPGVNLVDALVLLNGDIANPTKDIVFYGMSITSRIGHSNDPWDASTYPTTGGQSDGTIQTASPYIGAGITGGIDLQDPPSILATSSANATQIFLPTATTMPAIGNYVWSPGYYYQQQFPSFPPGAPNNTGIPNGTIVADIAGDPLAVFQGVISTGPPAAAPVNHNVYLATSNNRLWLANATPAWVDMGPAYIDIAACDLVANAATGCAATGYGFIPQCDPLIPGVGGGCGGSPAHWSGTTRALSLTNDYLTFTSRMTIVPSGWWNHIDWDHAAYGFDIAGTNNGGNDIEGVQCVDVQNNIVRWTNSQFETGEIVNSTFYRNRGRERTQDVFAMLSNHRVIISRNFSADSVFDRGHPDFVQFANGTGDPTNTLGYYGNAVVDNEFYTNVDTTDPFPFYSQGIGATDEVYTGTYFANNIMMDMNNPSGGAGHFNVVTNNTFLFDKDATPNSVALKSASKVGVDQPAFSLMANNISNTTFRSILTPGVANSSIALNINSVSGGTMTLTGSATIPTGWDPPWTITSSAPGFPATVTLNVANTCGVLGTQSCGATGTSIPVTASGTYSSAVSGLTINSITGASNPRTMSLASATIPAGATISSTDAGWPASVVTTANCVACTSVSVTASATFTGPGTAGAASALGATATVSAVGDCSLDANTVENNLNIPVINVAANTQNIGSSTYCNNSNSMSNSTLTAVFPDFNSWSLVDFRSGTANQFFTDYNPINLGPPPAPGSGINVFDNCLRNEYPIGTCAPGAAGRLDFHLNAAFVPTSPTPFIGGTHQLNNLFGLPTSGATNDAYLVGAAATCIGGFTICTGVVGNTYPAGVYTRATSGSNILAYNITPFSPGAIGAGIALGAQMPPANHARQPWTSPPNIGAY